MNLKIVKDTFESKDGKKYYVVRYVLLDEKNNVVRKGEPIIWLTEEQYNNVKF